MFCVVLCLKDLLPLENYNIYGILTNLQFIFVIIALMMALNSFVSSKYYNYKAVWFCFLIACVANTTVFGWFDSSSRFSLIFIFTELFLFICSMLYYRYIFWNVKGDRYIEGYSYLLVHRPRSLCDYIRSLFGCGVSGFSFVTMNEIFSYKNKILHGTMYINRHTHLLIRVDNKLAQDCIRREITDKVEYNVFNHNCVHLAKKITSMKYWWIITPSSLVNKLRAENERDS